MLGKLHSHWIGPFEVTNVFPYGIVEIKSRSTNKIFKVNGHHLKLFYPDFQEHSIEEVQIAKPHYLG